MTPDPIYKILLYIEQVLELSLFTRAFDQTAMHGLSLLGGESARFRTEELTLAYGACTICRKRRSRKSDVSGCRRHDIDTEWRHRGVSILFGPCTAGQRPAMSKAIDYMRRNVSQDTMADLVIVSQVAERTLLKHFRAFVGLAPLGYLRRLRCERRLCHRSSTLYGFATSAGFQCNTASALAQPVDHHWPRPRLRRGQESGSRW